MPKKRYWRGESFSDRRQAEQQRLKKDKKIIKPLGQIGAEFRRTVLRNPKAMRQYVQNTRRWEVLRNFNIPTLFHAGVNPTMLIEIIRTTLKPYYHPEKVPHAGAETGTQSIRIALHALFPRGAPVEVRVLMNQKHPAPTLYEEIVAWSLLSAGIHSTALTPHISVDALHNVLVHHPAYHGNTDPKE